MSGSRRTPVMIDVTRKPVSYREATAMGRIRLKPDTIKAIVEGRVEKGDVLQIASIAAIMAVKKTPEIVPLCHPLPITGVNVDFNIGEDYIEVTVNVKTKAETGVEMEALTGASAALLAIWDTVKKYEKDDAGQYPHTFIEEIRVIEKIKKIESAKS